MVFRCSAVHHNYKRTLATKKVDEELKERIDGESLIDIAYGVDEECGFQRDKGDPGRYGVYRDHKEYSYDISLK